MKTKAKTISAKRLGGGHMGGQGTGAKIPVSFNKPKPTGHTPHPASKSNSKGARKFNHG